MARSHHSAIHHSPLSPVPCPLDVTQRCVNVTQMLQIKIKPAAYQYRRLKEQRHGV